MIERLVRLFVAEPALVDAPPTQDRLARGWMPPAAGCGPAFVVVLALPGCADLAGAAVGFGLAARGERVAVVCRWSPGSPHPDGDVAPLLASPAARRLARRLQERGLEAVARGRLAQIALAADADEAARVTARTRAAGLPLALVLDGARDAAFDALLADASRIVVAAGRDASPLLVDLALADAARCGRSTALLRVRSSSARAVAAAGLAVPPALRRVVQEALEGLPG